MKTDIGRVVVTSTLMVLLNMAGVSFSGPARVTAAEPAVPHVSEAPTVGSARFVPGLDQQFHVREHRDARVRKILEITSRADRDAQGASPAVGHKSAVQSAEAFGYSAKHKPLEAYVIGDGPNVTMIFGAFHQDEPASAGVVEALRVFLTANPRQWKGSMVVLVPHTNPDGALLHERTNANGVDLNRNFPGTWSSISLGSRYNPGSAAASEPETRAIMQLVEKYSPSKVISIHQPFRCLNWDGEAGRALAEEMSLYNGYPTKQDIGYPTPGSFGTYCARKGIAVVTLEMPSAAFPTCWRQNKKALLAAIRMKVPTDRPQTQTLAANAPAP